MKLQCIIMTPVLPDVAWYKDGEQLDSAKTTVNQQSNGIYSAELEIKSVQYSDTGFYTCMVQPPLFGLPNESPPMIIFQFYSMATKCLTHLVC